MKIAINVKIVVISVSSLGVEVIRLDPRTGGIWHTLVLLGHLELRGRAHPVCKCLLAGRTTHRQLLLQEGLVELLGVVSLVLRRGQVPLHIEWLIAQSSFCGL